MLLRLHHPQPHRWLLFIKLRLAVQELNFTQQRFPCEGVGLNKQQQKKQSENHNVFMFTWFPHSQKYFWAGFWPLMLVELYIDVFFCKKSNCLPCSDKARGLFWAVERVEAQRGPSLAALDWSNPKCSVRSSISNNTVQRAAPQRWQRYDDLLLV